MERYFHRSTQLAPNILDIHNECISLRNNFYRQKDNPVEQSNCLIILRAHALTCEMIFRSETENLKNVGFEVKAMLAYIFCNWPRYPELKEAVVAIADWLIRTHEENEVPVCETYVLAYFATAFSTWRDLYEDEYNSLRRATGVIIEIFEKYKEINTDITSLNSLQNAFEMWGIFDNDMFRGMVAIARNVIVLYNSNELYDIDPDELTSTVFNLRKCVKEFEVDPTIRLAILSVAKQILLYSHNSEHDRFTPENLTKLTTSFSIKNFIDDDDNTMKNAMVAISVLIYQTYVSNGLEALEVISLCNIFNNLAKWSAYRDMMMEKTIIAVAKILITKQDIFVLPEDVYRLCYIVHGCCSWYFATEQNVLRDLMLHIAGYIERNNHESLNYRPSDLSYICYGFMIWYKYHTKLLSFKRAIIKIAEVVLNEQQFNSNKYTKYSILNLFNTFSCPELQDDENDTLVHATAHLILQFINNQYINCLFMENSLVPFLQSCTTWYKKDDPSLIEAVYTIAFFIINTYNQNQLMVFKIDIILEMLEYLCKWRHEVDHVKTLNMAIVAIVNSLMLRFNSLIQAQYATLAYSCTKWFIVEGKEESIKVIILKVATAVTQRFNYQYETKWLTKLAYSFSKIALFDNDSTLMVASINIFQIFLAAAYNKCLGVIEPKNLSMLANACNIWFLKRNNEIEQIIAVSEQIAEIIIDHYGTNGLNNYKTKHLAIICYSLSHWPLRISGNIRRNAVFLIAKAFHQRSEFHRLYPDEISFLAETFSKCVKRDEDDDEVDQEEDGDEVDKEEDVESLVKSVIVIAKHTIKFEDEQPSEHDALGISSKYKLIRAFDAFRAKARDKRTLRRAIVALAKLYERENVLKLYEGDRIELLFNIIQVVKTWTYNTMEEKLVLKGLTIAQAKVINEVETSWDFVKNHAPRLAVGFTIWRHEDDEQKSLWKATLYLARHVEAQVKQREFPKYTHIVKFSSFSEWHKLDDEQQSIRRVMVALRKSLIHNFEGYGMNNYSVKELALLARAFGIWSDKDEDDQFRIAISLIADTIICKYKTLHLAATLQQLKMLVVAFSEFCSKHSLYDNYPLKSATKSIAKAVPKVRTFKCNNSLISYSETVCELVNTLNTLREIPPIYELSDPIIFISSKLFEQYEINQLEKYSVNALCDYISALAKWQEEDNDKRQLKRAAIAIAKVITLRYENEISPQLDHHHLLLFAKACMVWYGNEDEYEDEELTLRNAIETIANIIVFHFNSDICMDYSVTSLSFFADAFSQWEHEIASPQSQIPTAKRLVLRHLEYDKY
ncbi:hypothetical protein C0J52_11958 [Blattella germanica]|nr:hypothetical protein C0J52_11958 [Blattella germanica]